MSDHRFSSASPVWLTAIKAAHTIVWAFFVACIVAIPFAAWRGEHHIAGWMTAVVAGEVLVLAVNGWRCLMTSVPGRFTDERRENFDIYVPVWLAKHNKLTSVHSTSWALSSPSCSGRGRGRLDRSASNMTM